MKSDESFVVVGDIKDNAMFFVMGKSCMHMKAEGLMIINEQSWVDRWLMSGLDRGLLAEVRAWALTFALYSEGRKNGTFQPIPWVEPWIKERRVGESEMTFAFRTLDPRFKDPVVAPFDKPLVKEALNG